MTDFVLILFGITGDLAKRKIIPAIYTLFAKNKINNFAVVGVGLEQANIREIFNRAKEFILDFDEEIFDKLIEKSDYVAADLNKLSDFENIKKSVLMQENKYNLTGNRLFYCSIAAELYGMVTQNCSQVKLLDKEKPNNLNNFWHRIVYEKPFGQDYETAKLINNLILKYVDESQIFRIDHYIAKEIVEAISFVRFTNRIFEPLWNNYHIDSVQIILDEEVCLEGRNLYYDKYGALKDVVQNHILQLISLVAMEPPQQLSGDYIRDSKVQVLRKLVPTDGFFGQYIGYKDESGIKSNSTTDTFVVMRFIIDDSRWSGVPFYIKTGKCLDRKTTKICIRFKHAYCLLSKSCPTEPNYLIISIFPEEGISIELNVKKPNSRSEIIRTKIDYCYSCIFEPETPQAYESILLDIISGERSISVRQDEIEYSWQIIDKIISMNLPMYQYKKGTSGPKELETFANKYNLEWK